MSPATKTYDFTLLVHGADVLSDESMNVLFETGCGDATFGSRDGAQYGTFGRQATSFSAALATAIHDLTNALPSLEIARVEPDGLVRHLHTTLPLARRRLRSRARG